MRIDKETGLPELPEGYFWRISERHFPVLEIIHRSLFFGEIRAGLIELDSLKVGHVKRKAKILLQSKKGNTKNIASVGDYPPKKLGE